MLHPLICLTADYEHTEDNLELANLVLKAINLPNTTDTKLRGKLASNELTWRSAITMFHSSSLFNGTLGTFKNIVVSCKTIAGMRDGNRLPCDVEVIVIDPRRLTNIQRDVLRTTYANSPMHLKWHMSETKLENNSVSMVVAFWIKTTGEQRIFARFGESVIGHLGKANKRAAF